MIKQFVTEESCLKCHGCCRFAEMNSPWAPLLLKEEAEALAAEKLLDETMASAGGIPLIPNTGKEGGFICPFFNIGLNQCRIYRLRPFECRLYPFLLNRQGSKVFLAADFNCPFLKENPNTQSLKEYASFLTTYLNSPYCQKLLSDNHKLLQEYDGVVNLSELSLVL
jgi:Fe-S-cluster containining protein